MNITILTVIDTEWNPPHQYVKRISRNDVLEEVETAFEELDIHVEPKDVEDIAHSLKHDKAHWFKEHYCFELLEV